MTERENCFEGDVSKAKLIWKQRQQKNKTPSVNLCIDKPRALSGRTPLAITRGTEKYEGAQRKASFGSVLA